MRSKRFNVTCVFTLKLCTAVLEPYFDLLEENRVNRVETVILSLNLIKNHSHNHTVLSKKMYTYISGHIVTYALNFTQIYDISRERLLQTC